VATDVQLHQRVTLTWSSMNGLMNGESHPFLRSTRKNNRRRGSAGGNTASTNPSAQETKNRPKQDDSGRRRVKVDSNPEGVERNQQISKTS
jgi:hypothetical protein